MVIKCASTTTQVREKKFIATGQVRDCFSDMKNNTQPYRKKMMPIRASTIRSSQQAIRIKIIYLCLVGGERRGERRRVGSHARASSSTCS
jgi:hypothetical protein